MPITNNKYKSTTYKTDNYENGAPTDTTWYTVTNYSGSGVLSCLQLYFPTTSTGEYSIAVDGGTATVVTMNTLIPVTVINTIPMHVEFKTSLIVKIRRNGDTNGIGANTHYAIL